MEREKRKHEDTALGYLVTWWTTRKAPSRVAMYSIVLAELLGCLLVATWLVVAGIVAAIICVIVDLVFFAMVMAD